MQKLEKHDKLGNYNNWPLSTVLTKKMTYIYIWNTTLQKDLHGYLLEKAKP